ncbi:hypothetical protein I0618_002650 [Staphylococcus pseudintermedius]|nr:hypothetical protein [Staphylococcus pseudintermedius]EGQ3935465.1 hypothetical protein [Staphylococcus pseudintermedius]
MLKTILITSTLLLPIAQTPQTDFDSLDNNTKNQIEQTQSTFVSYAIAENAQTLRVFKHAEDSKMLSEKEQYTIYSDNLIKGTIYKITYKGDYVKSIDLN